MVRITNVAVLPQFRLHLRFDDDVEGVVELSDLVGRGVFAAWTDESIFAKAAIDPHTGTVCWPGGIDLCPDSLYEEITGRSIINQKSVD